MASVSSESVPRLEWDDFLSRLDWRQGQHVGLIGPTGAGKTTLALNIILERRKYVLVMGAKKTDETLTKLIKAGRLRRVKDVRKLPDKREAPRTQTHLAFWPEITNDEDTARQAYQIGSALRYAYDMGGWCVFVDDMNYVEHTLRLRKLVEFLLSQGRSERMSFVGGNQRPAWVTTMIYDQPTHLFFWAENDERNLKRIAGLNGANSRLVRETVASLDEFEVLYVRIRGGSQQRWMCRTTPPES